MKKLAVLLAIFCMSAVLSQAATTIVLTHSSTPTTYSDLDSVWAVVAPGDTVDIQDFDGPLTWTKTFSVLPSWTTLECTKAGAQATLLVPGGNGGNNSIGALDHTTLLNLIIDGQGTSANAFNGGSSSTVTNCTIKNFTWNNIFIANGSMTGGVQDPGVTFTDCYMYSTACCLAFTGGYVSAPATIPNKTILNHCTMVNPGGFIINLDANLDGKDLKSVYSIRNSILSSRDSGVCVVYAGAGLTDAATQVDEDYNLFDCTWNIFYGQGGGTSSGMTVVGAHSFTFNKNDIPATHPDYFRDYAAKDFRLGGVGAFGNWVPGGNICIDKASDGGNIGADITTVPVELSNFSAE